MKKVILIIVTIPLLILMVAFDIIKLPIVIGLYLPITAFLSLVGYLKGDEDWLSSSIEFMKAVAFLGFNFYLDIVFDAW